MRGVDETDRDIIVGRSGTGGVSITSAVSINGQDTIERADGRSWTGDGFAVGQSIVVTGSANNDGTYQIAGINGNTLVLAPGNVVFDETDPAGLVSVDGPSTISRSDGGSFVADGLTPGQIISVSGTASNDGTYTIGAVSPGSITIQPTVVSADGEPLAELVPASGGDETITLDRKLGN